MRKLLPLITAVLLCRTTPARPSTIVPFTIEASEDVAREFPGAPRLQSFSFAQWKGRWIFIGGRMAGYHAVGGGSAEFLRADANRDVWVVDTIAKPARTYHVPVAQLPSRLATVQAQWTATGLLYFQDGEELYICGGYGQDEKGNWSTFDVISRVSLPLFFATAAVPLFIRFFSVLHCRHRNLPALKPRSLSQVIAYQ